METGKLLYKANFA